MEVILMMEIRGFFVISPKSLFFQSQPIMIITSMAKQRKGLLGANDIKTKGEAILEILEMTCHICTLPYNSRNQLPISLCPEEHTYCSECVSSLFSRHPNGAVRCPSCRIFIYQNNTHINKTLLRLCDSIPKLAEEYLVLQREKEDISKRLEEATLFLQINEKKDKENIGKLDNDKDQFNGFPLIKASDYINKPNKMNIHSYVAQRRRAVSKSERSHEALKIDKGNTIKRMI